MSNNEQFGDHLLKAVGEHIQNVGKQIQKAGEQIQKSGEQIQFRVKQEKTENLLAEGKKHDLRQANVQQTVYSHRQINKSPKHILALLIKSDRYQDLIHSLKNDSCLRPENSSKLYGATQGLWIGAKSKFNQSKIKQELINCNPVTTTSEYDVHFVTIELDEDDSRFYPDVNPMDRRDAFIELVKRSSRITVSPRLSCKAYENTEFYSR